MEKNWITKSMSIFLAVVVMITAICAFFVSSRLPIAGTTIAALADALDVKESTGEAWNYLEQLNIFNQANNSESYIAPSSEGSYQFTIENSASFPFVYTLQISDENLSQIPMQFRLHDASGNYIIGSDSAWVPIEDITNIHGSLDYQEDTNYTLDWRWPEETDVIDTSYGILAADGAYYTLNFLITAQQSGPAASPWVNHNRITPLIPVMTALIILFLISVFVVIIYAPQKGKKNDQFAAGSPL